MQRRRQTTAEESLDLSEHKLCRGILHLHDVDADCLTLAQRFSSQAGRRRNGPRTAFGGSDCRSTMNKGGLPWQWFRELHVTVAHAGALARTAAHVTQDENAADSAHVKADGTRTVKCGLSCIRVDLATSESSLLFLSPILQVLIRTGAAHAHTDTSSLPVTAPPAFLPCASAELARRHARRRQLWNSGIL